jgi:2,4-dienoyl-CoA reductase-like NADH-dependent reductase (Old Yellow Enzyme family)
MSDPLFEPLVINGMTLNNRIIMPAMHLNMCRDYQVGERLLGFYAERAAGGAGLLTAGYAAVDELSAHPGHIGAQRDDLIPGLARLAATIQEGGARAALQLNHAGRYNHSFLMGGRQPVAPSAVPSRLTGETPHELTLEEIDAIVSAFAAAAARVRQAGFDAVEVLAGTGYLISQFLSPLTNRRSDGYGGDLRQRMRFGLEVVAAVRRAVGSDFPLVVRLNGNDLMPGGGGRKDLQEFAVALTAAGADALCVNVGWHEAPVPQIVTKVPRGVFGYLARGIKERVTVPVIASHRINDPQTAREMLATGQCDAVAMGRALIADPQLPTKARAGREAEIVHCVACGQGCFDNLFKMKAVECLCNPRAGREAKTAPLPAAAPRRVLVVGGGPAGMAAALAAADCGHLVTLAERGAILGGQLALAGAPPGREEFAGLARDLATQVAVRDIPVLLGTEVDAAFLDRERPEAVILASGGRPSAPPIPGADLPHVVQAWEVLSGKVAPGRRTVVVGGGAVGVETALLLAEEGTLSAEAVKFLLIHGAESGEELAKLATRGWREVTVVELLPELGGNFGKTTRWGMLQDLKRYGVASRTATRVLAISPRGLILEGDGGTQELAADTVVLAVGTRPEQTLQQLVEARGIPCRVCGDAASPGMVIDAVHQGFAAGREVA